MIKQRIGWPRLAAAVTLLAVAASGTYAPAHAQRHFDPDRMGAMWPNTDFSKHNVPFEEIFSGGVPRDGIPPIDDPATDSVEAVSELLEPTEPVITVVINDEARAYPLGVLTRHEIVNDELGGMPIAVTFCPLCNSAVVFDRRVDGRVLDFGVSGMLRNSDLIMWDRQTESWWQQFTGEAIVGEMTGTQLTMLPVRTEAFSRFAERYPDATVNVGSEMFGGFNAAYLQNPYVGYDQGRMVRQDGSPMLFFGELPDETPPLTYVVAVENEAWTIDALRTAGRVEHGDLVLTWEPGQNAVMDEGVIRQGQDIGNVTVQRRVDGELVDAVHDVTFAFAFNAFRPEGVIYAQAEPAPAPGGPLIPGGPSLPMLGVLVAVLLLAGLGAVYAVRRRRAS